MPAVELGSWVAVPGTARLPAWPWGAVAAGRGKVLVLGSPSGFYGDGQVCAPPPGETAGPRAAVYDQRSHKVVKTARPPVAIDMGAAVLALPDRRVLVAGGYVNFEAVSTTAIWDPATGRWAKGPRMASHRGAVSLAALPDGRVLAVGGEGDGLGDLTAEIYDPAADRWRRTAPLPWAESDFLTAVVSEGKILVRSESQLQALFDPSRASWKEYPADDLYLSLVGTLPDGTALATSGADVYRFDAQSGWRPAGRLSTDRGFGEGGERDAVVAVLQDGRVLFAGGRGEADFAISSAELFDPRTGVSAPVPEMPIARQGGRAVALDDGSVLVVGGVATFEQAPNAVYEDTPPCIPLESRAVRWVP